MAEPIRIRVETEADAVDLGFALALRGLSGTFLYDRGWWIEVRHRHERTSRLLADVSAVLVDWLADRDCNSLTVYAGDRVFVLKHEAEPDTTLAGETSEPLLGTHPSS